MLKLRCFATAGILLIGAAPVSAADQGYRTTASSEIGLSSSAYDTSRRQYFTQPAYGDRRTDRSSLSAYSDSYYRSYHAHQDAALSGAYAYGAPWAWAYYGEGYPNPYHSYPLAQLNTDTPPPPTRRLLKTQDGQCYEVQRNDKDEELRTELSAEHCNW